MSSHDVSQTINNSAPEERGNVYRDLGVEPVINCAGVRTNYGASNPADEVISAMNLAASAFVDMDELAEGIGNRIAALTGAEWGLVSAGTASGLALATAACIAGNDPELMLSLPDTSGLRNKVLIPADQRFSYEQAIRAAGAEIVSVATIEELSNTLDGSVAMICLLGRKEEASELSLDAIKTIAHENNIPILVNAAGLSPANPDRWASRDADLVIYAGGKYLRGPQSTGIVLGKEGLCRAMWWNGAPHQSFGRMMKVGKEEAIGAVTALDRWINSRSAKTERNQWLPRLELISSKLAAIPGIETEVLTWAGSVTATRLKVSWDPAAIPFDAETLRLSMLERRPRILIHDFWSTPTSIILDPINLSDEEAEIVGTNLVLAFTSLQPHSHEIAKTDATIDITGVWQVEITFLHGSTTHHFELEQTGSVITGLHHTGKSKGTLTGEMTDHTMRLESAHEKVPIWLFYGFEGGLAKDGFISGTIKLGGTAKEHLGPVFKGQYGSAKWQAKRVLAAPDSSKKSAQANGLRMAQ